MPDCKQKVVTRARAFVHDYPIKFSWDMKMAGVWTPDWWSLPQKRVGRGAEWAYGNFTLTRKEGW